MASAEGAPAHGSPSHLLPPNYKRLVTSWLEEDTPSFDYGGFVVGESPSVAHLLMKSSGVVAGVPFVNEIFAQFNCSISWHVPEGTSLEPKPRIHIATVRGSARHLLLGERVALNILARCSGIAKQTRHMLSLLRKAGYENTLAGTRKTTPGFRLVEKYGMLVGGADPHRHDLSSMVMLKDNHIWACSGLAQGNVVNGRGPNAKAIHDAIAAARNVAGFALKIEVECGTVDEAEAAIEGDADIVMLDNFASDELKQVARELKEKHHTNYRAMAGAMDGKDEGLRKRREFLIEVSGGLTEYNVADYVCEDVDVISTSSIHQGVRHVDFSLKIVQRRE